MNQIRIRYTANHKRKIPLLISLVGIVSVSFIILITSVNNKPELDQQPVVLGTNVVTINPGDNIQAAVDSNPGDTEFRITAGEYRLQSITPKTGNKFVGVGQVILNGSKLVESISQHSGNVWKSEIGDSPNQPSQVDPSQFCLDGHERCIYPEELFVDDQMYSHVSTYAALDQAGEWYYDYPAGTIYLYTDSDPRSKTVELAWSEFAFRASYGLNNVTISNLTVEKYASPVQDAAIDARDGDGWIMENLEVRNNHSAGVATGDFAVLRNSIIHRNGQYGVVGSGSGTLIERNEIAYNNTANFDDNWGAGGSKWVFTTDLIVRDNYFHSNLGNGIWVDIDNYNSEIYDNIVVDNNRIGIFYEISFNGTIRDNFSSHNGQSVTWSPQILVYSSNTEVYDNVVVIDEDNTAGSGIRVSLGDRGYSQKFPVGECDTDNQAATCWPYNSIDNNIYRNDIYNCGNNFGTAGLWADGTFAAPFDLDTVAPTNKFYENNYYLDNDQFGLWYWGTGRLNWEEFKLEGSGNGAASNIIDGCTDKVPTTPAFTYSVGPDIATPDTDTDTSPAPTPTPTPPPTSAEPELTPPIEVDYVPDNQRTLPRRCE